MRYLPWAGRPDAGHYAAAETGHAVVSGVPPQPCPARQTTGTCIQHGGIFGHLASRTKATCKAFAVTKPRQTNQLFYLSSVIKVDSNVSESRRQVLKLMAASTALIGSGCSEPPQEDILPYVHMPERMVPGHPVFYASTLRRNGYGFGVLVETNMGRPTKIEGNPRHSASQGATDALVQAAILQLWDPDRSRTVRFNNQVSTWKSFQQALRDRLPALERDGGLRILTGPLTSPTLTARIQDLLQRYPQSRWHRYDPSGSTCADAAISAIYAPAHGPQAGVSMHYRLGDVKTLVTLDAELFSTGPGSVCYAREFMRGRGDSPDRSRLYAVETTPGIMGVKADERISMKPREIDALVAYLADFIGLQSDQALSMSEFFSDKEKQLWAQRLAQRLADSHQDSLLVGGTSVSEASHRLIWRINAHLGNVGRTLNAYACMAPAEPVTSLINDMQSGKVNTLLILDANPVYDLPADARFIPALENVACSIHMDMYADETAIHATWHLPRCHDLEDWGDARSTDATASIIQPAVASLYGARSPHWLLGCFVDKQDVSAYEDVRNYWRHHWNLNEAQFEQRWHAALREGCIADSGLDPLETDLSSILQRTADRESEASSRHEEALLTAVFVNDPSTDSGAYANLSWLQELPRPLTTITWDNAAFLGPETATRHGLITGDIVALQDADGQHGIRAPVYVLAHHAEDCVSLPLGYGRRHGGEVANDVGFDAYQLQTLGPHGPLRTVRVSMSPVGARHQFARTQTEHDTQGRAILEQTGLQGLVEQAQSQPSLYPEYEYPRYAWGMTIDLDTCIGCNACVAACQAENNIPVVGKQEVTRGRAMHWIRVDYYHDAASGDQAFQPMACQHCENAPCEVVCPVGATVHDSEGLNVQVYNRCVGTRFCSNNCPYKVRRFNFFQYSDQTIPEVQARRNPEVTVRQRGVMEKCTYCVQRISRARVEAEKRRMPIQDGEIVTACQAACPTEAIVFGDINDPASRVSLNKDSPRNYRVLDELNTRPRTSYLARVERKRGGHG